MNLIYDEINNLKFDYPKLSLLKDEFVFSLVCQKYFYNDGNFYFSDYKESFTDGREDGGIDLITVDQKNGQDYLVLIQSKFIGELANSQDVIDIFTKMDQTIQNFKNARTAGYNKKLKKIYWDKYDSIENQPPNIELVVFLSAQLTSEMKNRINNELSNIEVLGTYECSVYTKDDIEAQINKYNSPKLYVTEDKVNIAKNDGVIKYGETGLLVNVSALSLRKLYDKYKDQGLFEQNFRYFVRNKKIDESINKSLTNKRNLFWFLNNGVIIGCKDFSIDGDNVKLYDFSIINGCQTVTLIGEYKGTNQGVDFVLPCKIVKPSDENQFDGFIGDIAEASNSQKPISERDLKANKPEQKKLQNILLKNEPKIYLQVKRGEFLVTSERKKQLETWQYLENDYYGQMILAFHLQMPGTARSGKRNLFSMNSVYDGVFKRNVEKASIVDTLKIYHHYLEYLDYQIQNDQFADINMESVATNGKLLIPSIVGFMIKEKRGLINTRKSNDSEKEWENEIVKDCLNDKGLFVEDLPDSYKEILFDLFTEIIGEVFSLYQTRENEEKTVSNFFKVDSKYWNIILKHIVIKFYLPKARMKFIKENYLTIFQ